MSQQPIARACLSRSKVASLLVLSTLLIVAVACGPGSGNGEPPPADSVTIDVIVTGGGQAWSYALGFTCRDRCTLEVPEGSDVSLTAIPDTNRVLVAWDGPCAPFDTTCKWQATDDDAITLTFAPHALRLELTGDGEGRFEISGFPSTTTCRESCGIPYTFTGPPRDVAITYFHEETRTTVGPWTGACEDADRTNYCLTTVTGAVDVGTTWLHPPLASDHTFTTNQGEELIATAPGVLRNIDDTPGDTHTATRLTQTTNGTVSVSPDGTFSYEPKPEFGGIDAFTYRARDAFGNTDDGHVTLIVRPRLSLTKIGTGSGRIISEPEGIDCGSTCTDATMYTDPGTSVTLRATADPGNFFRGWSGACRGTDDCILSIDTPTNVNAEFIVIPPGDAIGTVTITPNSATLTIGSTTQLTATIDIISGDPPTDITWTSSNDTIASVDQNGLVTANTPGTTTITATSDFDPTANDTADITVATELTSDDYPTTTITLGDELNLDAPASGGLTPYTFTHTTGDLPNGATLNTTTGTITGTPTQTGTFNGTITITDDLNQTTTLNYTITVTEASSVTAVNINEDDQSIEVGEQTTLTATVTTTGTASSDTTWSSSNEDAATVNANGVVTGIAIGEAIITATSVDDTSKTDSITITVKEAGPPVIVLQTD